jgi:hypothetical protein
MNIVHGQLRDHLEADFPTLVDVVVATLVVVARLVVVASPVPLVAVKMDLNCLTNRISTGKNDFTIS